MKLKRLLGDPDFDCPPEMSEVALIIRDIEFERDSLQAKYENACSLLEACYSLVSESNVRTLTDMERKECWLEAARKHGAGGL